MALSGEAELANTHFYDVIRENIQKDDVMKTYNTWAETYDKDAGIIRYDAPYIGADELSKYYPNKDGLRIIDCAAGTGLVGLALKNHGFTNIDALDACPEMLAKAKEKNVYQNLICDYLGPDRLSIPDNTYDAMVAVGCFCEGHVKDDCFEELMRIVKPGGKIVIAMREKFLTTVKHFSEGKMESTMQRHHDNGRWKWLERRQVPNYYESDSGVVFVFQVC